MQRVKIDDNQIIYPYAIRSMTGTIATTMSDGVLNDKTRLNRDTQLTDPDSVEFHDLLMVSGVNSSDQAIRLNFHENYGGSAQFRLQMAASASTQLFFQVPWRMSEKGMAWWADYDVYGGVTNADDVTNTTVNVLLQFIRNTK